MTKNEIVQRALDLLNQHLTELRGAMSQECYQRDWFRLFMEAYRGGFLASSSQDSLREPALVDIIVERWFADDGRNDARIKLMQDFLQRWNHWRYALDHYEAGLV